MDESSLSAYARSRCSRRSGASTTPESFDHNGSQVEGKGRVSQARCYNGPYGATYHQGKERGKDRVRAPLSPTIAISRQLHTTSGEDTHDAFSERNHANINPTKAPESVDQVSLQLRPIKPVPVVNGSAVKASKEMESSRRSDYESTGIPDQETVHSAAISTPPPKESPIRNSGASLEETPPGTTTFKSLSKSEEIQLYTLLQRIRRLRQIIWGLRSRVQEQRGILRSKQYVKAAADDKYMQLARLKEAKADKGGHFISSEGKTLQELFQECERIRADYGPLEDDCNELEDQLGSQEYELTRLEENFVRICNLAIPHNSQPSSPDIILEGRSGRSSSDGIQNFHPLVANYLSKLGDVDIFRERHERHLEEKEGLEADRETRRRVNLTLSPEDEAWLGQSDELENEILRDLQEAQTEAEELRKKCLAAGLLDENGEPKDFQTQEQEAFSADEDVDAKGQKSEYVKFPTLLPQPGTKDMKFKASAPKPAEQSGSAGDHINQWLLHSLRSSPLDVYLLARTFEAQVGYFEPQKWQSDVRDHWYKDGAIKDASAYRIDSVTSETTPVYGRSKLSNDGLHEHKIEPVLGITGRKTAVSDTSSVSGSEFFGMDGENGRGVDPLPRSKYEGKGI